MVGDRWTNEEILCPLISRVYLAELSNINEESRHRIIRKRASKRAAKLQAHGPLPQQVESGRLLEEEIWYDSDDEAIFRSLLDDMPLDVRFR